MSIPQGGFTRVKTDLLDTLIPRNTWKSESQGAGGMRVVEPANEVTRTVFLWHSWDVIAVE